LKEPEDPVHENAILRRATGNNHRPMPRLVVATTNRGKLKEIAQLLDGAPVELVTLAEFPGVAAPEENGRTFAENARLKALYYARHTHELTVAEDSGLEIDALDGAPGVESARFGGDSSTYPEKFARIYDAVRSL
jgi:XTP/dITP diphosphohydrolase